jgi:rhamnosyl/mannosyltransferase
LKQRVLHVYQDFYPKRGGIEDHILTLAGAPSAKYEHSVLTAATGPLTRHETVRAIPVIRAGSYGRYYSPLCPGIPRWIKRLSPDIVHLHHPCPMAYFAYLLARPRAPAIVAHHNDIVRPQSLLGLYLPIQNAVLRRVKAILAGTQDYVDASPHLRPFQAKCRVIPYGIPLEQFSPTTVTNTLASAIRSKHPGPIVLFVGRLCYYKGLDIAIAAMRDVNASLLIVGRGPLERDIRRRIRALGLERRVTLSGSVDDTALVAHIQASDLTILPSTHRSEAFGLVMLQAQAGSRPVVCSDLPGLSTVNIDRQTGLLVPPGDSSALAEAINRLLSAPSLRRRMGRAGRRQVEQRYTAARMVNQIEGVYDAITNH